MHRRGEEAMIDAAIDPSVSRVALCLKNSLV
jgi:hypothetical protein